MSQFTTTIQPQLHQFLRCFLALCMLCPHGRLFANPNEGSVVQGAASITSSGSTLTVNQSTHRAVINWQGFSINQGESTVFNLPQASSSVLNRVTGSQLSVLNGRLTSNGNVYLVNPNGIVVGPGGVINTNSFVASTLHITDDNFLQGGDMLFAGTSRNAVRNEGVIEAAEGNIYLIGTSVENHGSLNAPHGVIGLGAGQSVTLLNSAHPSMVVRATDKSLSNVGVLNTGTINALQAELMANGHNVFGLAINNEGTVRATGSVENGGRVFLVADGGTIESSGEIVAKRGDSGGDVVAFAGGDEGTHVNLSGRVDVSGTEAGGTVYAKAGRIDISEARLNLDGIQRGQLILSVGPHTVETWRGDAEPPYLQINGPSGQNFDQQVIVNQGSGPSAQPVLKISSLGGEESLQASGTTSSGDLSRGFSGFLIESYDTDQLLERVEFNLDSGGTVRALDRDTSTVKFELLVREPDGTLATNVLDLTYRQFLDLQTPGGESNSSSRVLFDAVNGELIKSIKITSVGRNRQGDVIRDQFLNSIKQVSTPTLNAADPAILTVRKFVNGGPGAEAFEFFIAEGATVTQPQIADVIAMFELMHDGEINQILDPGTYTVGESVPEGWLVDIKALLDSNSVSSVDLSMASQGIALVDLADGETVVLEYTNTEGGTLVVLKEIQGEMNAEFDFEIRDSQRQPVGRGTLSHGESFSTVLRPGDYTISELFTSMGVAAEWATTITIGDGTPIDVTGDDRQSRVITLTGGNTIQVTFQNVQQGQIHVTKSVVSRDENREQEFSFELRDRAGTLVGSRDFQLKDGGRYSSGYIPPGDYSVEELLARSNLVGTVPDEWKVEVTVRGTSGPTTTYRPGDFVTLGAGEELNFVFTNTQLGQLTIHKITTQNGRPVESPVEFAYELDGSALTFLKGGESYTLYLEAGEYEIQELVSQLPSGWTLSDIDLPATDFGVTTSDLENGRVRVMVQEGSRASRIQLTFTNDFRSSAAPPNAPLPPNSPKGLAPNSFQYRPIYPRGTGQAQLQLGLVGDDEERRRGEITSGSSYQYFGLYRRSSAE